MNAGTFHGCFDGTTTLNQRRHESLPAISVGHNPLNTLPDHSQHFETGWRVIIGAVGIWSHFSLEGRVWKKYACPAQRRSQTDLTEATCKQFARNFFPGWSLQDPALVLHIAFRKTEITPHILSTVGSVGVWQH